MMKKSKTYIISLVAVICILVISFVCSGVRKSDTDTNVETTAVSSQTLEPAVPAAEQPKVDNNAKIPVETKVEKPIESQPEQTITPAATPQLNEELTCTLSVRCDTILNDISRLNPDKISIIPNDGVIFPEQTVVFYEGETVFNVLAREMKQNNIHMEFVKVPMYNSAYIEGIGNLYEFDCGELSGWMYKVNGVFPNYGCSLYKLKNGDKIQWVYTCDLGMDVGDKDSGRNGKDLYE